MPDPRALLHRWSRGVRRFYWRHVRRYAFEICDACGRPVAHSTGDTYWTAPDALWNEIEDGHDGIRCIPCFTRDCQDKGLFISWMPDAAVRDLVEAVQPILAAHRSTDGHVTGEQITTAWAAYDNTRRVLA